MSGRGRAHGPYETAADAQADAMHVYEAARAYRHQIPALRELSPLHKVPAVPLMDQINAGLLGAALAAAGVEVGTYERRIIGWLATFEPETVQIIIGWLERAHQA